MMEADRTQTSRALSSERVQSKGALSNERVQSGQPLSKVAGAPSPALRSPSALRTSQAAPVALPRSAFQEHSPARTPWFVRHFKGILFLLIVVLPACAATVYYCFLASPQYVTAFNLGIRMADATLTSFAAAGSQGAAGGGSTLQGGSTLGATIVGLESYVVTDFMTSRNMADFVDKKIGLRGRFDAGNLDFLSRLDPKASEEKFVSYWQTMIDSYFDLTTGGIYVKVRAFTPQDSLDIAKAVIEAADKRVSDMRDQARADELRGAKAEVAASEARVVRSRKELRDLRDKEAVFDPAHNVAAVSATADKLRDDMAEMEAEARALGVTMAADSPAMLVLQNRIAADKAQLKQVEGQITDGGKSDNVLAAVVNRFNEAQAEEGFAEQAYQSALQALETAIAAADREELFLVTYVEPSKPEVSVYPDKWKGIGAAIAFAMVAWLLTIIVIQSVRDHTL